MASTAEDESSVTESTTTGANTSQSRYIQHKVKAAQRLEYHTYIEDDKIEMLIPFFTDFHITYINTILCSVCPAHLLFRGVIHLDNPVMWTRSDPHSFGLVDPDPDPGLCTPNEERFFKVC